jgi:serine/threonine protein kinase
MLKYNIHSGNYVLLDFGLAVMTDEQRRTSLRKAGAVEFMAPEQNEGIILAQTDVYSFGVIIFELLAGSVPFPLQDKGETARNNVRLAHLETLPPDLISLRREALPAEWPQDKKEREMKVPEWLINLTYKCLKKKPENRFANGLELHDYIIQNGVQPLQRAAVTTLSPSYDTDNNSGNKQMHEQLNLLRDKLDKKERELDQLKALLRSREGEVEALKVNVADYDRLPREKGVSKGWFTALLLLTIAIAGFSAYTYMNNKKQTSSATSTAAPVTDLSDSDYTESTSSATIPEVPIRDDSAEAVKKAEALRKKHQLDSIRNAEKVKAAETTQQEEQNSNNTDAEVVAKEKDKQQSTPPPETEKLKSNSVQYMVVSKSYFYNSPDESTRRNTYIIPSNSAIVNAIEEQDGFVNVSFTNSAGQTIKGWVRKQTLQQINE